MDNGNQNPFQELQASLDAMAPHNVLLKLITQLNANLIPPKPEEVTKEEAAQAEAMEAIAAGQQAKPWTQPSEYLRYVTEREVDPRLMSYWKSGQNLVGETARSGVISDDKDARTVLVGLGDTWDEVEGEVYEAKAEVKPEGLPFSNQRKSGQKYWSDEPKREIETTFL